MKMNYDKYFEMKEDYDVRDFNRKKQLAMIRFELATKLALLMDELAMKRHKERCQILGIKYTEVNKRKKVANKLLKRIGNAIQEQKSREVHKAN